MRMGRVPILRVAGVLDQAFTAGMSAIVAILVARGSTVHEFGYFALVQALLVAYLGAIRSLPGGWILVDMSPMSPRTFATYVPTVLRFAIACGVPAGLALGVAALLVGFPADFQVLWILVLPVTSSIVQLNRLLLYSRGRVLFGLFLTFVQILVFISASAISNTPRGLQYFYIYIASNLLIAAVVCFPIFSRGVKMGAFIELGKGTHVAMLAHALLSSGRSIMFPWIGQVSGGLTAVAGVRGAQTVAAVPLQVPQGLQAITQASIAVCTPGRAENRILKKWATLQLALMIPMALLSISIPDRVGNALLGSSWEYAADSVPWILLGAAVAQLSAGYEMILRKHRQMDRIAWVKAALILPVCLGVLLGAELWGALGISAIILFDNVLVLLGCIYFYHRLDRGIDA